MNIFKGIKDHTVTLFQGMFRITVDHGAPDFGNESRQVSRAKLRSRCFNEMSKFDVSRRARRLMARTKANRVYREKMAALRGL